MIKIYIYIYTHYSSYKFVTQTSSITLILTYSCIHTAYISAYTCSSNTNTHTHIIYNLLNKYNIPLNKHESPESHTCNYLDITLNHIIFLVLHMLIHYIHTEHCLDLRTGQRRPLSTTANSHAAGAGRKHAQA